MELQLIFIILPNFVAPPQLRVKYCFCVSNWSWLDSNYQFVPDTDLLCTVSPQSVACLLFRLRMLKN